MENLQITSVEELRSYSNGVVVELPEFAEGQPFVARLRRPSLMALAKSGSIPNDLLSVAAQLFSTGKIESKDESKLSDMQNLCEILCKASLVEPTYDALKSAGIELSDDQKLAIFNYSQVGIKGLSSFRK